MYGAIILIRALSSFTDITVLFYKKYFFNRSLDQWESLTMSTLSSDACDSYMWNSDLVAQRGKYLQVDYYIASKGPCT